MPAKDNLKVAVVRLTGDLDLGTRDDVAQRLLPLDDVDIAVIDISQVKYADSSFMNALVGLYRRYLKRHTPFAIRLVGASAPLRRVFGIAQIDRLVEFWSSVDEASSAGIVTKP